MPSIVDATVQQILAPQPSNLQQKGALISQGATTLAAGATALLTQPSDLTALLAPALSLSSLSWSGGQVTVGTSAAIPGLSNGDTFTTTIAGAAPAGYNGTIVATVTGANAFTYALASNPGSETSAGTYTPPSQADLQAMVNSFFAQGSGVAVSVLELGAGDAATGPGALNTWITAHPATFYAYCVPRAWDAQSGYLSLLATLNAPTAKTYFCTTTTAGTYSNYPVADKCVIADIEAPGLALTEFDAAASLRAILARNPSATQRATQFGFTQMFGVTPYPTQNNSAFLATIQAANINWIDTGAEGGLPQTLILKPGNTLDGQDFSYWFSIDWIQVQGKLALANYIIQNSQNTANPLSYNQRGINRLLNVLAQTAKNAVSFNLAFGTVIQTSTDATTFTNNINNGTYAGLIVVNAIPFAIYDAQNPSDFNIGQYKGLSVAYIPQLGFKHVVFNIDAVQP